jgi:hypothetical protein
MPMSHFDSPSRMPVRSRSCGNGVLLEVGLAQALAKVSYKGLDLPHLHVSQVGEDVI